MDFERQTKYNVVQGVYFSFSFFISKYGLLVGWGKKYANLLRKNAKIRGNWWKNGEKEELFIVLLGKNIIMEK